MAQSRVPLVKPDLPALPDIADELLTALESSKVTNFGPHVVALEEEVEARLTVPALAVSSGTSGLVFALQAMGVGVGDEVAMPSFTFAATGQATLYAGATPVFVEVGDDGLIDPDDLRQVLSTRPKVKVVVPVHTYGQPADVDSLSELAGAGERPIGLLYDAAHAFGSEADGRPVGSFGDAEVFSLSATKALVSIEGGLVTSANTDFMERIRYMRNYGIAANYETWLPGMNSKMSEFHAVVGRFNLRRIDELLETRERKAKVYFDLLAEVPDVSQIPVREGIRHTYKDFTVRLQGTASLNRDALMKQLAERGVETRAYFHPPLHQHRHFNRYVDRELPRTDALASSVLVIPFFTSITEDEMAYVATTLTDAIRDLGL